MIDDVSLTGAAFVAYGRLDVVGSCCGECVVTTRLRENPRASAVEDVTLVWDGERALVWIVRLVETLAVLNQIVALRVRSDPAAADRKRWGVGNVPIWTSVAEDSSEEKSLARVNGLRGRFAGESKSTTLKGSQDTYLSSYSPTPSIAR